MSTTKKITVNEFTKKYNAFTSDKLKEDFLKSVIKDTYVPFEKKIAICEKIIESSYYVKDQGTDGVERKKMRVNSPAKYMLYSLNLVDIYTNIEIDFKNSLEEFNVLNGLGYLDFIVDHISEKEIAEFRTILDMVERDTVQNEYEIHSFISNQVERFGRLAGVALMPMLEQLTQSVDNMDDKTVNKFVNGLKSIVERN